MEDQILKIDHMSLLGGPQTVELRYIADTRRLEVKASVKNIYLNEEETAQVRAWIATLPK